MFELVVNSTTVFSPDQTENCGVQYVDMFHASTVMNRVLFLHNSEELASEEPSLVPFGSQTIRHTADAARLHRRSVYENYRRRNSPLWAVQHKVNSTTLMLQPLVQTSSLHGGVGKQQMS